MGPQCGPVSYGRAAPSLGDRIINADFSRLVRPPPRGLCFPAPIPAEGFLKSASTARLGCGELPVTNSLAVIHYLPVWGGQGGRRLAAGPVVRGSDLAPVEGACPSDPGSRAWGGGGMSSVSPLWKVVREPRFRPACGAPVQAFRKARGWGCLWGRGPGVGSGRGPPGFPQQPSLGVRAGDRGPSLPEVKSAQQTQHR